MGKVKITGSKPPKAKAPAPEHAVAVSRKPFGTDEERISSQRQHSTAAKGSSAWSTAPDVQSAMAGWDKATADLDKAAGETEDLRDKLAAAMAVLPALRNKYGAARKHALGAVNVFAAGSSQVILDLGFDVRSRSAPGDITTPDPLVTNPGAQPGEVDVSWDDTINRHGFMLQHASDPTNAATHSTLIPCTVGSYTLRKQATAAVVHFRVAAVDPDLDDHMTEWSAWTAGTAR